jgi:pilus assembly protein CpaB
MRPKTLILFALALGCGSIAAVGINQVLSNRAPAPPAGGDNQSILVAMADVNMGELITPQMVKLEKWPKDNLPQGALVRPEDIEGRRAKVKLFAGEPILEAKLLPKGTDVAGASQFIPKGYRVVAVKVDDISAASNLIKPGDRVDVLVHLKANPGSGINETRTITVLQDIKVFSVNDVFHTSGDNQDQTIAARTVSMLVTPEQAELITHATEMGQIRLVMRSVEDDSVAQTHGATQTDLLGQQEHGERDKEGAVKDDANGNGLLNLLGQQKPPQPAPALAQATPAQTWRMVLIEADKAHEVRFDDPHGLPTSVLPLGSDQGATPLGGPLPQDSATTAPTQNSAASESAPGTPPTGDEENSQQEAQETSETGQNVGNN